MYLHHHQTEYLLLFIFGVHKRCSLQNTAFVIRVGACCWSVVSRVLQYWLDCKCIEYYKFHVNQYPEKGALRRQWRSLRLAALALPASDKWHWLSVIKSGVPIAEVVRNVRWWYRTGSCYKYGIRHKGNWKVIHGPPRDCHFSYLGIVPFNKVKVKVILKYLGNGYW